MKLCVALDMANFEDNINLAKELKGLDIWLKVGLRSYLRDGVKIINEIKNIGDFKVFLDLKLYDIPNTMADAAEVIAKSGVDMINLHASAGLRAMKMVMDRLSNIKNRPLVLAVSALTSFNQNEFMEIYNDNIQNSVIKFSQAAYKAGLDGMVSSVFESKIIKENTSRDFITLTPGIRPFGESSNDQQRVANIQTAKEMKSDFIVVGRPIYEAKNPREVVEKILKEI
ncbi:orotidine 5'-phosphate decarboxylase [Campylobacter sputorum subsp. bubulus]|uniref:Orotidine 5'-phosphate decarboxylase n=1 Tax=Campylobacter sputorum subsp. sputorum TaxID=32024 RepID=A0A381DJX6_9BACT|nr:orotidine-5'-phosphate decarboxylase [Campylobacter sputorum]ASM34329.1 orotidine-5'-phosphate decarboxylase [Campylobacter sputorum aubsp. sputorum RM3237]ASM35997.1 orotidine-5'-phosphate decarboxylase [Campylobacter sputorum bv. faecalis CCUG 20703]KAB0582277.1 orotidine-5'-phosphate decarboxylase [Campylobacter sputorum subsp. sputorum]QEL04520.1 orotidine-5'-phosphate decarboxylase [Campylobacter sputorum subsp. sputorum]SUX09296.1 orotidine 5'-phosphate decarboxylase [Campylobacter sp